MASSNYYPMVSSSPPPLDDGPSFEEDDGEFEFGNFDAARTEDDHGRATFDLRVANPGEGDQGRATFDLRVANPGEDEQGRANFDFRVANPGEDDQERATFDLRVANPDEDDQGRATFEPDVDSSGHKRLQEADGAEEAGSSELQDVATDSDVVSHQRPHNAGDFDDPSEVSEENDVADCSMPEEPVSSEGFVKPPLALGSDVGNVPLPSGNEGETSGPEETATETEVHDAGDVPWPVGKTLGDDEDRASAEVAGIQSLRGDGAVGAADAKPEDEDPPAAPADVDVWGRTDSSFDDFTDFQTAPGSCFRDAAGGEPMDSAKSDMDDDDSFDDFATFDQNEGATVESEDAGLSSCSFFVDEEFGNFASSERFADTFAGAEVRATIPALLASAFPDSPSADRSAVDVRHLDEALRCAGICDDPKTLKSLWSHLHDIDNTHALTYHWSQSQSNKKLLRSLRIDARNFLAGTKWNSSVPLFAATLGSDPLEPKKASLPGSEEDATACDLSALKFGATQETAVPPARFDWGSSGLVNPLDDSTSCTLLDLDFFLTNDICSASTTSPRINSLESEFLGNSGASEGPSRASTGTATGAGSSLLVDKIMSQAAKSSSATFFNAQTRRRASNLSQEAIRVLDSLPDLTFVRAKVLMFPIRGAL